VHERVARLFPGLLPGGTGVPPAAAVAANARELASLAVFGPAKEVQRDAGYVVRTAARRARAYPASIASLYAARGRGDVAADFTVPAINVRGMSFDVASAAFRAMKTLDAGAVVFELNRAEVAFTDQPPREFAVVVLAAALAEGWSGPVFIQLDHLMADAAAWGTDPEKEVAALERLISDAVRAGFYNVDIDASTLVDLSQPSVPEQQRPNIDVTALLARYVRSIEPPGVRVSLGGEIGEVGGHNSTEEELRAFVDGFLSEVGDDVPGGLAKVSVQTGTTHGGVRLPDGSIAAASLDFETLGRLSTICRAGYGMAGAVQHGASTLPLALFGRFPECGCAEVHLATGFQDLVLDHPAFPSSLRRDMEAWTLRELEAERRDGETDTQFVRRARRKAWGPFKGAAWALEPAARDEIMASLETQFVQVFGALRVGGTRETVARLVASPPTSA
jgi:fructose/tagatose bisphosphate aldolase